MSNIIYYKKFNKTWPKKCLDETFAVMKKNKTSYTKAILDYISISNSKNQYLPKTLYKFYAPTSDNILDIKNRRLWMAHPSSFNDPFDCCIGFDQEAYEKYCLLRIAKEGDLTDKEDSEGFSHNDVNRIELSKTDFGYGVFDKREDYFSAKRNILEQKSDIFKKHVNKLLNQYKEELEYKLKHIQNPNIRVGCFSELDDEVVLKKIQMWSHYADNHKGFCVEYDISPLIGESTTKMNDYDFYDSRDEYLAERVSAVIKGGLFPVIYSSQRVNFPVTKLYKSKIQDLTNFNEAIYKSFIIKSTNWSYEKEWRIIINDRICKYYDNKIPFPYIKRIYLGCKMNQNLINTMLEIGEDLGIEVLLLEMNSKKFTLDKVNLDYYKWQRKWNTIDNPFT